MTTPTSTVRVAVLHAAGYAGGELLALLAAHPAARVVAATSRHLAGEPAWAAHPRLRATTDLRFVAPDALDATSFDAAFVCAEHRQGATAVAALRGAGFDGLVVDLSADHRLRDPEAYAATYGTPHPAPDRLSDAVYGLTEAARGALPGARLVANPGCFATGIALALRPLEQALGPYTAHVVALTGASGSGGRPSPTTHFPSRDGNVRAYAVLAHRHLAEVRQTLGPAARVAFVPASGPWTRGIWGTATVETDADPAAVGAAFEALYADCPLVRLSPGSLPELLPAVGTPFCDVGWMHRDGTLVVGFALDNLLKGAASQAVQNLNLALGLPETLGLLPAGWASGEPGAASRGKPA